MEELRLVAAHGIDPDRYRSYLVRLWREAPGAPWRCQVQCVNTGQERRFSRLAELFEFLVADTAGGKGETRRGSGGETWRLGDAEARILGDAEIE